MQKVLMIAPTPFFADRGCHTQIYEEIVALKKLNYQVRLVTYGLGRDVAGIDIVRIWNPPWYKKLEAGPSLTKIFLIPLLLIKVLFQISEFKPDIVHSHLHEGGFIALFCRILFPNKVYVFDMQGSLTGELVQHKFVKPKSLTYKLFQFLEKTIANSFLVVTQSETMVKELLSLGVEPRKIRNVKDGVDTNRFRPIPKDEELAKNIGLQAALPCVLFMGIMETYQGMDLLMEAFSYVQKEFGGVQFVVIGYPNLEKYKAIAEELNIKHIHFLGRIDYAKLENYLSLSQIAVAPKIAVTEGDGKIYNYMAMGMATVAFDRSVSREILGSTGLFAQFGNSKDLAEKIVFLLKNPEEASRLGKLSRERAVRELSWDAVGQRISEHYQSNLEPTCN